MGHTCSAESSVAEELPHLNILAFCDWRQRAAAAELSHGVRQALGFLQGGSDAAQETEGYWRFLCDCLSEELEVHVPPPAGVAASYRALFEELYAHSMKDLRQASAIARAQLKGISDGVREAIVSDREETQAEEFKIGVAARLRPAVTKDMMEEEGVVLPLHQKVQLVKKQLGCSSKEALSLIMRKQHRLKHGSGYPAAAESDGSVFQPCRIPGSSNKENIPAAETNHKTAEWDDEEGMADARCSILSVQEEKASLLALTKQSGLREYTFDRVFGERAAQADVFAGSARRLVMEFLNGTSASIICYGQTASGKTHTMFGPPHDGMVAAAPELQGLVPRTCAEVLERVDTWRQRGVQVHLSASYVELFGSEVSDLLREGEVVGQGREGRYSAVRATDRVGHRYVLDGHTEFHIESLDEVFELLRLGDAAKRRAATAMNERSTRAHTVFVLSLSVQRRASEGDLTLPARRSRFYFADLGGSEQLAKSKVEAAKAKVTVVGGEEQSRISWQEFYLHRQRLQETMNINKGLFSLKRVIEVLHRRSRMAAEGVPVHALPYVPYQDSKLTMLLQEALGGSARTLIITTATMDPAHAEESLQTLRFAETCAQVQKRLEADQAASITVALDRIEQDIQALQAEIARKERWETRLLRRRDMDSVAGEFGAAALTVERTEVIPTTVLVGAEGERAQLETLLERQAELQGLCSFSDFGKDYRSMRDEATKGASDGGRGVEFWLRDFGARTKAKDFEDEAVLAGALRSLFHSATNAEVVFGEKKARFRVQRDELPQGYHDVATALRNVFQERVEQGKESRSFGKAMLDRCTAWRAAFKENASSRDAELSKLVQECGLQAPEES
mmetsp:Transcript_42093/g.98131  ORF Transcript_42093/g.98131 Transcript_42093/m.98131 type:complete len:851 (-) Transcript_42093:60-2612(-)